MNGKKPVVPGGKRFQESFAPQDHAQERPETGDAQLPETAEAREPRLPKDMRELRYTSPLFIAITSAVVGGLVTKGASAFPASANISQGYLRWAIQVGIEAGRLAEVAASKPGEAYDAPDWAILKEGSSDEPEPVLCYRKPSPAVDSDPKTELALPAETAVTEPDLTARSD